MKNRNTVQVKSKRKNMDQNNTTCLNMKKYEIHIKSSKLRKLLLSRSAYRGNGFVIVSQSKRATIKNSVTTMARMTHDWRPKFSQSLREIKNVKLVDNFKREKLKLTYGSSKYWKVSRRPTAPHRRTRNNLTKLSQWSGGTHNTNLNKKREISNQSIKQPVSNYL